VVSALSDPSLCLPAANALKNMCDSNRIALASHITAFGELHAGLTGIPVGPLIGSSSIAVQMISIISNRILNGLKYYSLLPV
jgi:hypothetical protein